MTRNEILTALNKRDDFVLALVEVDGTVHQPMYPRKPPFRAPDFSEGGITVGDGWCDNPNYQMW